MLYRCYPNIKDDLETLVNQGWLRVIKVNKTSTKNPKEEELTKVYFACDLSDQVVEGACNNINETCHKYLTAIWGSELGDTKMNWEKTLQDKPELLSN